MATTYTNLDDLLRDEPPAEHFTAYCYRSIEADALTVRLSPEPDYSERLTDHVTLFRSIESKAITGCRIKGVEELLRDLPNYIHVDLKDGVRMSLLFLPFRGSADEKTREILNGLAKASEGLTLPCGA